MSPFSVFLRSRFHFFDSSNFTFCLVSFCLNLDVCWLGDGKPAADWGRGAVAHMGSNTLNVLSFRRQCWARIKAGLQLSIPVKSTGKSLSLEIVGFWTPKGLFYLLLRSYMHDLPLASNLLQRVILN